jgi:cyanate permease
MLTNRHYSIWLMLGCAWLLGFSMYVPIFCVPPMEHIISTELDISHAQMGLLFSLPVIMLAAAAIPSGLLADRIGVRKAAGIGALVIILGSILRGTSTSFEMLLGFTVLFGIGFALVYPNLPKLISAWFSKDQAGLATGIYATGIMISVSLSLAITLPIVLPITNSFNGVFYLWSIPPIIAAILWWIVVREPPASSVHSQRTDLRLGQNTSTPVWRNKNLWFVAISLLLLNFHFYIWAGWSPALLVIKGADPQLASLITSVMSWTTVPIVFLIPWASNKVGLRKPFLWSAPILMVFVSCAAIYASVPIFWLLAVIIGIALGGAFAMILALPVEMVPKESVGKASGMMLSIGYVGGLAGPWIAGYIFDSTGGLELTLIILVGLAIVWAVISSLITETGSRARLYM